jgi:hypothetical protein
MAMLAMAILVHFWVLYWTTSPPARTPKPNLRHYTAVVRRPLGPWRRPARPGVIPPAANVAVCCYYSVCLFVPTDLVDRSVATNLI